MLESLQAEMWPLCPQGGALCFPGCRLWLLLAIGANCGLHVVQPTIHTGATTALGTSATKQLLGPAYRTCRPGQIKKTDSVTRLACMKDGPGAGLCPGDHRAARLCFWLLQLVTCALLWAEPWRGPSFSLLLFARVPWAGSASFEPCVFCLDLT